MKPDAGRESRRPATIGGMESVRTVVDDRYRLEDVIGRGGMSTVYRATDRSLGRTVAIKVLSPALADDGPVWVARFEREARAAGHLDPFRRGDVYDTGVEDGMRVIVMECIAGRSLATIRAPLVSPRPPSGFRHEEGLDSADWLMRQKGTTAGAGCRNPWLRGAAPLASSVISPRDRLSEQAPTLSCGKRDAKVAARSSGLQPDGRLGAECAWRRTYAPVALGGDHPAAVAGTAGRTV